MTNLYLQGRQNNQKLGFFISSPQSKQRVPLGGTSMIGTKSSIDEPKILQ